MRTKFNEMFVDAFNNYLKQNNQSKRYTKTDNPKGIERILNEFRNTDKYQVNFLFEDDADWGTFLGCIVKALYFRIFSCFNYI